MTVARSSSGGVVTVQLPTSAVNVALPAFAAASRAAAPAVQQSIDISYPPEPTAANPPHNCKVQKKLFLFLLFFFLTGHIYFRGPRGYTINL